MFMKNLKNKFFSVLLISIMVLSSMNVIAAVSDDSAIEEETEDALMEVDNSDDNDLKKDAEKTDKVKSDDPKDDVSDDGPSADEENKLTVTNYSGTYDGKEHSITVKASKSGTTFEYSLDNKTWVKEAPRFKDANGTQTVYIKAENGDDTIYDNGTVTINPVKITLTADSASKTYDGSALKSNGYSITKGSFASGEGLEKVVVSGSQTEVGSSKNQITKYSLKSNTKAQNYDITLKAGTLTVKKSKTPAKKEEKKEPKKESKLNNTTNKTNKTNTTVIPQQNTGIPVLVLAFSLFVIATLVKRD
jgi:hypothetical protein